MCPAQRVSAVDGDQSVTAPGDHGYQQNLLLHRLEKVAAPRLNSFNVQARLMVASGNTPTSSPSWSARVTQLGHIPPAIRIVVPDT